MKWLLPVLVGMLTCSTSLLAAPPDPPGVDMQLVELNDAQQRARRQQRPVFIYVKDSV